MALLPPRSGRAGERSGGGDERQRHITKPAAVFAPCTTQRSGVVFGQERADVGSIGQTDYGYTGQRDNSYIKLIDLNFRWMDPLLGRFVSPDDIVPDLGNPQSFNRYSYVNNSPIAYSDPTGHETGDLCDRGYCAFPEYEWMTEHAADFGNKDGGVLETYAVAGIGVQNPTLPRPDPTILGSVLPNRGIGWAKVSKNQMDTPYGEEINDNGFRGYGLGLTGQDQTQPQVAISAMMLRIRIMIEKCDAKCTVTDIFLIAALAENGPGFNADATNVLLRGDKYRPRGTGTTSLQWQKWLNSLSVVSHDTNQDLIAHFASNTQYLQSQGWQVPNVDWAFVYSLAVNPSQP